MRLHFLELKRKYTLQQNQSENLCTDSSGKFVFVKYFEDSGEWCTILDPRESALLRMHL